ncbi:olfactory receptor 1f45-like [Gastrophryne carolinensis]
MKIENNTFIYLLGFPNIQNVMVPFFFVLIIIYILTIIENILIIMLVAVSKLLHSPMYFFLTQVSLCDILVTTAILPNVLYIILHDGAGMTFYGCFIQIYFFGISEGSESFLLTVMSYDRYVAICNPLHYTTIINLRFCVVSASISWLFACLIIFLETIFVSRLLFCRQNIMDHFFCDFEPLLELSCSDTFMATFQILLTSFIALVCPFTIIVISYVYIIMAVFASSSNTSRQKAFSTCSSHLTVVSMFYGSLISVYLVPPSSNLLAIKKTLSIFNTMVIPLLNPLIYSLRNKDMKISLDKIIHFLTSNI